MRAVLATALILPIVVGAAQCKGCDPKDFGQIANAIWRSSGNSFLWLDSETKRGVLFSIYLAEGDKRPVRIGYPPAAANDPAFIDRARLEAQLDSGGPVRFQLECGATPAQPSLTTTIVFWSEDHWSGTSQTFRCGAEGTAESRKITAPISGVRSLCIVSDRAGEDAGDKAMNQRRLTRCLSGPRCDDAMRNGSESDVDCGGTATCARCGEGDSCNSSADCSSGKSCDAGRCRAPTCRDGVRNQGESDTDCGGPCGGCGQGRSCSRDGDCASSNCDNLKCVPRATCNGKPDNGAARVYSVLIRDRAGCGGTYDALANNLDDAKKCATAAGWTTVSKLCKYRIRIESNWTSEIIAPSSDDALNCVRTNTCARCSLTVEQTSDCVSQ